MVLLGRPSNNVSIGIVGMPNIGKSDQLSTAQHSTAQCHCATAPRLTCLLALVPPRPSRCFAPGTRVRLMNGDTIAVEEVRGREVLMGDDSTPRVVTPGSLVHGEAPMFRIEPGWEGAKPFTVNGAHTLVLVNNNRPRKWEVANRPNSRWRVQRWELTTDNRLVSPSNNTPPRLAHGRQRGAVRHRTRTRDRLAQAPAVCRCPVCLLCRSIPRTASALRPRRRTGSRS